MVFREMVPWRKGGQDVDVWSGKDEFPLGSLQRKMNRMFDDFLGDVGFGPLHSLSCKNAFFPRMDVSETEKEITITAELAGIEEKDVDVTLQDGVLTIRGEKKVQRDEKQQRYRLTERSCGTFIRSLTLPVEVEQDEIQASFRKGVLTVRLPKLPVEESKAKKIEIKSE